MIEHFRAADWVDVPDCGRIAVVVHHGYDDPSVLLGRTVVIDDVFYTVEGIETHAVLAGHSHRPIGLLVERAEA